MEASLLGGFMVSACLFGILYEHPTSPVHIAIASAGLRRALMGLSMGITAVLLIYSPFGKQSGAHFNPSVTLTFLQLGKIAQWDAAFYMLFQFLGGVAGVLVVALSFPQQISHPAVNYVATVPGASGVAIAVVAEAAISFALMATVLRVSGSKWKRFTGLFAGALVAMYIALEAPISGMSMNPTRTFGSAIFSHTWHAAWIYFVAPPVGMLLASRVSRPRDICAKLIHHSHHRCIHCGANGGHAS